MLAPYFNNCQLIILYVGCKKIDSSLKRPIYGDWDLLHVALSTSLYMVSMETEEAVKIWISEASIWLSHLLIMWKKHELKQNTDPSKIKISFKNVN